MFTDKYRVQIEYMNQYNGLYIKLNRNHNYFNKKLQTLFLKQLQHFGHGGSTTPMRSAPTQEHSLLQQIACTLEQKENVRHVYRQVPSTNRIHEPVYNGLYIKLNQNHNYFNKKLQTLFLKHLQHFGHGGSTTPMTSAPTQEHSL